MKRSETCLALAFLLGLLSAGPARAAGAEPGFAGLTRGREAVASVAGALVRWLAAPTSDSLDEAPPLETAPALAPEPSEEQRLSPSAARLLDEEMDLDQLFDEVLGEQEQSALDPLDDDPLIGAEDMGLGE